MARLSTADRLSVTGADGPSKEQIEAAQKTFDSVVAGSEEAIGALFQRTLAFQGVPTLGLRCDCRFILWLHTLVSTLLCCHRRTPVCLCMLSGLDANSDGSLDEQEISDVISAYHGKPFDSEAFFKFYNANDGSRDEGTLGLKEYAGSFPCSSTRPKS